MMYPMVKNIETQLTTNKNTCQSSHESETKVYFEVTAIKFGVYQPSKEISKVNQSNFLLEWYPGLDLAIIREYGAPADTEPSVTDPTTPFLPLGY